MPDARAAATAPRVAVCIPTHNHAPYLREAVLSALHQTHPDTEVWVSDDASTDDTPAILAQLQHEHPKLRVHRHERNVGTNANVRALFQMPDAPFIGRLDSDDVLEPRAVEVLLRLLQRHPRAGYTHSAVLGIGPDGTPRGVRRLFRLRAYHGPGRSLRDLARGPKMCANMPLYRREALASTNFLEGMPFSGEDYFTIVRLAAAGWGNAYTPEPLGRYRTGLPTQWTIGRNIKRARGLVVVFAALEDAYRQRGWSIAPIQRLRRESAVGLARAIYPRRGVTEDQKREADEVLPLLCPAIEDFRAIGESPAPPPRSAARLTRAVKARLKAVLVR